MSRRIGHLREPRKWAALSPPPLTLLTTESDAFRTMDDRREPLRGSLSYTYTHVARDLDFSAMSKKGEQSS
jgi:hypothetical protein